MDLHELFVQRLTPEEEQLVIIRQFLYEGNWSDLVQDLKSRLGGKPYVFKLSSRIEEDLERISRLRTYEAEHGIDLWDYLVRGGKYPELTPWSAEGETQAAETIALPLKGSRGKASKSET